MSPNNRFSIILISLILLINYLLFFKFKKQTKDFFDVQNKIRRLKLVLCLTTVKNEAVETYVNYKNEEKEGFNYFTIKLFFNNLQVENLWESFAKSICLVNIKVVLDLHHDELINSYSNHSIDSLQSKITKLCNNELKPLLISDFDFLYQNLDFLTHDEKIDISKAFGKFQESKASSALLKKAFFDRSNIISAYG